MSSHLAVVASLALAILLSPETLVLGLIIASDKKSPRLAAFAFAIGGIIGIAMATGIGLWIAHASAAPGPPQPRRTPRTPPMMPPPPATDHGPASACAPCSPPHCW